MVNKFLLSVFLYKHNHISCNRNKFTTFRQYEQTISHFFFNKNVFSEKNNIQFLMSRCQRNKENKKTKKSYPKKVPLQKN
jgi:hypothetical protein